MHERNPRLVRRQGAMLQMSHCDCGRGMPPDCLLGVAYHRANALSGQHLHVIMIGIAASLGWFALV